MKWNRIGYIEGHVKVNDSLFTVKSILFVRDPFLWFKTRKVVEIGDRKILKENGWNSESIRVRDMKVRDWLLGARIQYVSENGTNKPADIIKLVKK
jgi:hypothetical protein